MPDILATAVPVHEDEIVYQGMTRAMLDAAYNNTQAVSDSGNWLSRWQKRGEDIRSGGGATLNVPYGDEPKERFDYFACDKPHAPLFVFIHGGYWQRNDKETFSFVSDGPRQVGFDVAVIGYTLAPAASLTEIVGQMNRFLAFLAGTTHGFSFDRRRVIVGGWSAGGHLSALADAHPICAGTLLISGIFDLKPIALSYINDKLRLTSREIEELSPVNRLPRHAKPCVVVAGEAELSELKRQSQFYAEGRKAAGSPTFLKLLPGHNHYSILSEFSDSTGMLTHLLQDLASRCPA